jgi:hypothetical protein
LLKPPSHRADGLARRGECPEPPELDEDVMRIAAFGATLLLFLQACSTTPPASDSPYQTPNSLMSGEITQRVEQIPYQHRDELLQNLMWLAQTGEQTIPAMLQGLRHENAKVRSSSAWVLGRIRDRRTIPALQQAMRDDESSVRMEVARSLVTMGDMAWSPALIEGLDSDKKEVRYMCHEALKTATGHDFGYDHLQNDGDLRLSTLRWRQWWSEYSGDTMFAASYQQKHGLQPQLAVPAGETQPNPGATTGNPTPQPMPMPMPMPAPQDGTSGSSTPNTNGTNPDGANTGGASTTPNPSNGTNAGNGTNGNLPAPRGKS